MINEFKCSQVGGANTGIDDCSLQIGKIVGFFLVWPSFTLTAANLLNDGALKTAMLAAASADIPSQRIYPVHMLEDITDNSAEPQQQTFGYGTAVDTDNGTYDWTFPFLKGGLCLLKALQMFNKSSIRVIFYDAEGTLFGQKVGDTLKGIPLNQFVANKWTPATGTTVMGTSVKFNFQPKYINEQIGFYKVTDFSFEDIEGLRNASLSLAAAQASPVFKFKVLAGCQKLDLFDLYEDELADENLWEFFNADTGASVGITSVAADTGLKAFTVTLVAADILAATRITGKLAAPSVLTAAGLTHLDSVTFTFTKVA